MTVGYNTNYSLKTELIIGGKVAELVNDEPLQAVIDQLRKEDGDAEYALAPDGSQSGQGCKWYEHERNLRDFSKKHPSVLFTLHGEGEENEDIWNKYFLNGRCQVAKAQLNIADFDAKKLT